MGLGSRKGSKVILKSFPNHVKDKANQCAGINTL